MRWKIILWIFVCLFLAISGFAQNKPIRLKSPEIFKYSQKIAESVKDEIWMGFDARRYFSLKSNASGSNITFTSEPDNPNAPFFWEVSDEYFSNHSLEENLSITFHEAFHGFERNPKRPGGKWGAENALLVFEYAETSAKNNALFAIEGRILFAALKSSSQSMLKQRAREFLAVRKLRQSEFDTRFVEFEKGAELNEGLAEYAGTQAVVLGMKAVKAKKIAVPFADSDSRAFLNKKYEKLNSLMNIGRNIRLKFYYTGSVQGFLLDRLSFGWKAQVQMQGATLQDLLKKAVETNGKSLEQEKIEDILQRYDYEKVLQSEETAVAQRKASNQALFNSILDQKGWRIVIDYSALSQPAQIRSFDPMNVTMINPKLRVHTRTVNFAANNSFTARFSQAVIEDLENKRYITVVPENEILPATADGETFELVKTTEKRFEKSLVINAAGLKFEAISGSIKTKNGEIVIRLIK
jgi:hypothetical protein